MTHYSCPCLNVNIHCVKGQGVEEKPGTAHLPVEDPFFASALSWIRLDKKGIQTSQSCLLGTRGAGQWAVHTCLSCKQDTHATSSADADFVLVNPSLLLSDATQIKTLSLSVNYSQVFQLILPPAIDNPVSPGIYYGSPVKSCQLKTVIQSIRQQSSNFLFQEQKQMEDRVRTFTEQQYALYASLQSRVTKERQSFIDLISRSFQQQQKDGMKMVLPSPFENFPSPPTSPDNSGSTSSSDLTLDRHETRDDRQTKSDVRLMRKNPANGRTQKRRPANGSVARNGYQLSKSVDTTAIFDMDGLDDDKSGFPVSEDEGDTDDSTTEEQQQALPIMHKYASSVPISVPFMTTYNHINSRQENPTPDDPDQIAASIKALALSVVDDKEMFGDRPRRRLNTGDLVKSRPI